MSQKCDLTLRCPFCNAEEDSRVEAVDHSEKQIVLVMFDCPFSFKFELEQMGSDELMQKCLDDWRVKDGDSWLQSLGPVIRDREMQAMKRADSLKNN